MGTAGSPRLYTIYMDGKEQLDRTAGAEDGCAEGDKSFRQEDLVPADRLGDLQPAAVSDSRPVFAISR